MAVAHGAHRADVLEAHRLPAAGIVGDREHHERDVFGAGLRDQAFERGNVHVALERVARARVASFRDQEVDGARPGVLDVGARGVEVAVVRDHLSGTAHQFEEDAFAGATLVGGQDVLEAGERAHRLLQRVPALGTRVGLVAAHDTGPLQAAHRTRAAVGQEVDEHVVGVDAKQIEVGLAQDGFAFLARGHADGFDDLDAERLDDGLHVRNTTWPSTGAKRAWKKRRCLGSCVKRSPTICLRFSYSAITDSAVTSMCACV